MQLRKALSKINRFDSVIYLVLFAFSYWLMFKTFGYDAEKGYMLLAPIVQSDFAAHIPLIRSFSLGDNWPPEYPLYPGQPIQYHFLFYFLVGMLERFGLRIDWALNSLSILGFFFMVAMTYAIGKKLFNDRRIGLMSVIFFIFNGTLSFWYFFTKKQSFGWEAIKHIVTTDQYASFGPWDGSPVLIFWNLNTFINQRHFCLALGILLVFVYIALNIHHYRKRSQIAWGVLFGLIFGSFPLLHKPVMLLAGLVMAVYFVCFSRMRLFMFVSGAVAFAGMVALYLSSFKIDAGENSIAWSPGFLVPEPQALTDYLAFFFYQFGFHCFLIPIGFLLASRTVKIIMLPAILALVISFLLRFSIDVSANHKLINFSIIMLQMLSAFALVRIYTWVACWLWNPTRKLHTFGKSFVGVVLTVVFFLCTLSGIMDIFVAANQHIGERPDVPSSKTIEWISKNTPRDAVFLNGTFIFDPASVAGRKIYLGYAYFIVSAGYDWGVRVLPYREIYTSDNPLRIIKLLNENNIDYVEFHSELRRGQNLEVKEANEHIFKEYFPLVFTGDKDSYDATTIYQVPSEKEWLKGLSDAQRTEVRKLRIKEQGDNFLKTDVGAGSTKLNGHAMIAVDQQGNIYVQEMATSIIYKYSGEGDLLASFGSRGDKAGQTKDPNGLAVDKDGFIYVADTWNHRVQKLSPQGVAQTEWAGSSLKLFAPNRIRIAESDNVYILDTGHHRVVKLSPEGKVLTTFGEFGSAKDQLNEPTDLLIIGDFIYVADTGNLRMSVFNSKGEFVKSWPIKHWEPRSWNKFRLAWNSKTKHIYITNFVSGKIFIHDEAGNFLGSITPAGEKPITGISDVFVSPDNELFAFDTQNAKLLKIQNTTPEAP